MAVRRFVADLLPAGTYSVLRPQFNPQIFRSERDVAQTLRQFQAVLWYRGGETTVSSWLRTYQDSIGGWLDAGGKLYVDGLYLIQGLRTPGAFREEFVARRCGSAGLVNGYAYVGNGAIDSTAGWSFRAGSNFRSSRYGEMPRALVAPFAMADSSGGVRVFAVTDTSNVALWGMEGQMQPPNLGFEAPVGVSVPQGNGGRLTILTLPIRFLTARDGEFDTVAGLRLGADDYLTKDISLPHLLARVAALFRRADAAGTEAAAEDVVDRGKLRLDTKRVLATWAGLRVDLTVTEFWIVHALARRPGHVKDRDTLMRDAEMVVDDGTITSHVKRIRRKFLALDPAFDAIETVYGMGYRWTERA